MHLRLSPFQKKRTNQKMSTIRTDYSLINWTTLLILYRCILSEHPHMYTKNSQVNVECPGRDGKCRSATRWWKLSIHLILEILNQQQKSFKKVNNLTELVFINYHLMYGSFILPTQTSFIMRAVIWEIPQNYHKVVGLLDPPKNGWII